MNKYKEIVERALAGERLGWTLLYEVPRFKALMGNPENKIWHREGTTGSHLALMWNILLDLKEKVLDHYGVLNLSILLHDCFKPDTLIIGKDRHIHNYGHETLASRYMWDMLQESGININTELAKTYLLVCRLVYWHMNKNKNFFSSRRGGYCLSSFSAHECRLLSIFHSIDMNGAISDQRYDQSTLETILEQKARHHNYVPTAANTMHLMVGPSGCGKSTVAKSLCDNIISSDDIREELLGDVANQDNNELVFTTAKRRAYSLLSGGNDIVIDATNTRHKTRKNFIEAAQRLGANIQCHVFLTTLQECVNNQNLRERRVPMDVIKRQYEALEIPCGIECNESKFYLNNGSFTEKYN